MAAVNNRPLVLYGAGGNAANEMDKINSRYSQPVCFCDADPGKHGTLHLNLPVMSLAQAYEKYGDFDIHITLKQKEEIVDYLIKQGVEAERITHLHGKQWYLSCSDLEQNCIIEPSKIFFCCPRDKSEHPPGYEWQTPPQNANMDALISEWIKIRDETIQNLKIGMPSKCDGCPKLSYNWWTTKKKTKAVTYNFSLPCQLKCTYCFQKSFLLSKENEYFMENFDYERFINVFEEKELLCDETLIHISTGEISINPRKNDILKSIGQYNTLISTNAVVFDEKIAYLTSRPGSSLSISLDAGTKQTYKLIKGVDAFEQVLENTRRYAEYGACINIKYIIMPENCGDNDVYGLIEELSRFKGRNVVFVVSTNVFRKTLITDKQIKCAAKMVNGVTQIGIKHWFVTDMFISGEVDLITKAAKTYCF